jgi:hypothetical protein
MSIQTPPPIKRFDEDGFIEAYGAAWGFRDLLPQFYAPTGSYTDMASMVTVQGHDQLDRFMKVYLQFSPECTVTFTKVQASGVGFTAEWMWEGTSDGKLWLHGVECPQDGSRFSIPGVAVCTVDDEGRVSSHTDYWDSEAMLRVWRGEGVDARTFPER